MTPGIKISWGWKEGDHKESPHSMVFLLSLWLWLKPPFTLAPKRKSLAYGCHTPDLGYKPRDPRNKENTKPPTTQT